MVTILDIALTQRPKNRRAEASKDLLVNARGSDAMHSGEAGEEASEVSSIKGERSLRN